MATSSVSASSSGLVGVLRGSGLDHRVLKGAAVADLDYPDPALRSFVDVDLLVRAEEWDDAIHVLREAGWERQFAEPRPGFERRFVKGMVLTRPDDGGTELDLHRTLALGPFGLTVRLEDLWADCEVLRLGGVEVRALAAEERFLHACFHAVLGDLPPRLVPLRDIAQMSLRGNLDLDRVIHHARSWRAEAVLLRAVELTWETLGLDPAAETASPRQVTEPSLEGDQGARRLSLAAALLRGAVSRGGAGHPTAIRQGTLRGSAGIPEA